jgi:hypothetical protein
VRNYATNHGLDSTETIEAEMAAKLGEFVEIGSRVHLPVEPAPISAVSQPYENLDRHGGQSVLVRGLACRLPRSRGVE